MNGYNLYPDGDEKQEKQSSFRFPRFQSREDGTTIYSDLAEKEAQDVDTLIIQLLATRSYCLPGNTRFQDWVQFFQNCHPVLGICFQHELHPFTINDRVVFLVSSFAFGLAATSSVILWFFYQGKDLNAQVIGFSTYVGENGDEIISFKITSGMIALLTFGGALHSVFDLTAWYITSCPCCRRGGFLSHCGYDYVGSYISVGISIVAVILSLTVVTIRIVSLDDVDLDGEEDTGEDRFKFLSAFMIEMVCTWFIVNPFVGTVLFTGVLGCKIIPVLGGRPYEKKNMDKQLERIKTRQQSMPPTCKSSVLGGPV